MATIGVFFNLPATDPEVDVRKTMLARVLSDHNFQYAYGEADYDKYGGAGNKADMLVNSTPAPDYFLASCWPSMDALTGRTGKGIVFAGLTGVDNDNTYKATVTGIRSFAIGTLCAQWQLLLNQMAGTNTIKRFAVIHDQEADPTNAGNPRHPCMKSQFQNINSSFSAISADDPMKGSHVNPKIGDDIKKFFNTTTPTNTPAGLIVTAGTRTALLRNDIIKAVNDINSQSGGQKLYAMYPNSMFVRAGGLMSYGPDIRSLYRASAHLLQLMIELNIPPNNFKTMAPIIDNTNFFLNVSSSATASVGININTLPSFSVNNNPISPTIDPQS